MTEPSSDGGHHNCDALPMPAAVIKDDVGEVLPNNVTRWPSDNASVILFDELRETHRLREDFHREEKSLTLRIKAIERRLSRATGPLKPKVALPSNGKNRAFISMNTIHGMPDGDGGQYVNDIHPVRASIAYLVAIEFYEARAIVHNPRLKYENRMKKMTKQLPVYDWMKGIPGFGELGLAQIIATTGNLFNYSGPYKVFKMMSMHVVNGRAARRVRGRPGGLEQQFSPQRRAIMNQIGKALICHGKKTNSLYYQIYVERKEYEKAKAPDLPPKAHHRRAQRYMEKQLLKHLWQQWRKVV